MEQKNKLDQACMMQFIENLDAAAVLDETGTYIYVSPSWQRFTGHTAQDALGRKVWELLPDTHAPEVLRTGKPVLAQVVRAQGVPAVTNYIPRLDANGKVIGVDTDQAVTINKLGTEGMTVTSAMKGLGATVKATLKDVIENGNWANYGGKIATLGLVSGDDPELNYVQIPMESTQWTDNFTKDDYKALVKSMFDGTVKVSDDTSAMPAHSIIVNEYDNIM